MYDPFSNNKNFPADKPWEAPWNKFQQPSSQYGPHKWYEGAKKNRRLLKKSYYGGMSRLMEYPYTRTKGFVNSQIADVKNAQIQGQKQAQANMLQQANKLGTVYSGMGADATREQTEGLRQKLGAQINQINREAVDENRRKFEQALALVGSDVKHRQAMQAQVQAAQKGAEGLMNQATPAPSSKVICAELYRQGLMPAKTFRADEHFGAALCAMNPEAIIGYHLWAFPVVALIKNNKFLAKVTMWITRPWAEEMEYIVGTSEKSSFAGRCMVNLGIPMCTLLGKLVLAFKPHKLMEIKKWQI